MHYIDLTHTFKDKMPTYPGDPDTKMSQIAEINTHGYTDHRVETCLHVGTHMDAPLHMIEGGKRLSDISPDAYFGRGRLIDARGFKIIDANLLEGKNIMKGDVVVIFTGFYKRYGKKEYFEKYPEVTKSFAQKLIDLGVKMLLEDTPSPDREPFEIHKMLLRKDILIVENITDVEKLLKVKKFEIMAIPTKLFADAAPVRVLAKI